MKSTYIGIYLFLLVNCIYGQETYFPNVKSTNVPHSTLLGIEIKDDLTYVAIMYSPSGKYKNEWMSISSETYINDYENPANRLKIISFEDHNLDTRYNVYKGEQYFLTLVFPKIPPNIKIISIYENINSGFFWRGITINNSNLDNQNSERLDETTLINNWRNNGIDKNEGIYENMVETTKGQKYKLAVNKTSNGYALIYLSGENKEYSWLWSTGETKAYLIPTATPNMYRAKWYRDNKTINENLLISFENGLMELLWTDGNPSSLYIKLFPSINDDLFRSGSSTELASGTAFGITSNGLIITNYHIIDGANKIYVRGINSDFNKRYNAKVVVSDKINDLAIIQIDDKKFKTSGNIPFSIKTKRAEVGESVFVLGYPLRSTMGDEIKLSTGVISSQTGFKGDVTTYQISAPVQPGNSGGPVFDSKGNLIGVLNAKHSGAESVSYAIKVSYLTNLFDLLDRKIKYETTNLLLNKSLSNQVEILKEFVYIIEIE
jgi:S1-C subfamily serine protease